MKTIVRGVFGIAALAGLLCGQSVSPAGKTAGEAFKNVVALRDAPQQQFLSAMTLISGSLGVACTYCHAQPYESDAKAAKVTARNMIRMTLDINARSFGGKPVVTCNTCHQGSTHPNGLPAVWDKTPQQLSEFKRRQGPALAPQAGPLPSDKGEVLPSADQILDKYAKAVRADLAKSMHVEGFVTSDTAPRARSLEIDVIFPDRMLLAVAFSGVQSKNLITADHAWAIAPQGVQEVSVELARSATSVFLPMKLTLTDAKREVLGVVQVDGRPCYLVKSSTPDSEGWLYFDKQNGLLYKTRTEYRTPLGLEPTETTFDDYTDVGGIKLPSIMTRSSLTDRAVYRCSKMEMNIAIDPAKFDPPPAK